MKVIICALICTVGFIMVQSLDENLFDDSMKTSTNPPKPSPTPKPPVNCHVKPDDKDEAIILPNPKDCGSYYVCVGLQPIWMPCPDGLHFNPDLKVCDWPAFANCTVQSF
ncbi:peritrophin-1-like [Chelonus insularis]|uniref:peritrophin-1-like n=1 Tax=Chelonus insularis TaxID=460826 RepID=UPI001588441F|nr:peritrophin-1-like [Chelonus insularis]